VFVVAGAGLGVAAGGGIPWKVGARDLELVRSLNPRLQTFRSWLNEHIEAVKPA
jgi:hypothetical protein